MATQIPIIMYHRIGGIHTRNLYQGYTDANIVMSEDTFYSQIKKLLKYYSIISLGDLANNIANGFVLPTHPCVITFDDGFHEMYDVVFPILMKLNLSATFFISGNYLAGTNHVRWLDLYYQLLDSSPPTYIDTIIKNTHPNLQNMTDIRMAFKHLLRQLPLKEKYQQLSDLKRALGVQVNIQSLNESLYLSPKHITEMANAGMYFGAHSMTHQVMAGLGREAAIREVDESIRCVREITKQKEVAFAYPFGGADSYTMETVSIVRESGVMCGCTSIPEMNNPRTPLFELRRIPAETFVL